jgi:hypothetical protein
MHSREKQQDARPPRTYVVLKADTEYAPRLIAHGIWQKA